MKLWAGDAGLELVVLHLERRDEVVAIERHAHRPERLIAVPREDLRPVRQVARRRLSRQVVERRIPLDEDGDRFVNWPLTRRAGRLLEPVQDDREAVERGVRRYGLAPRHAVQEWRDVPGIHRGG